MVITDQQLEKLLLELKYLPEVDIKKAKAVAASQHQSLQQALVRADLISDDELGQLIAYSLQMPFTPLSQSDIPDTILRLTPLDIAKRYRIITFAFDEELRIATSEPGETQLYEMLAKKAGAAHYRLFYATDQSIEEALRLYTKPLQAQFEELFAVTEGREVSIAEAVDTIFEHGYDSKASDVHLEPTRSASLVRFRIDGILHDVLRLPKGLHSQLVTRIKVLARLRTDEHFSAQDGRISLTIGGDAVDVRVSTVPVVAGEKVVMRLLATHFRQFGLTDLGMQKADLAKVKQGFTKPYGMVLCTGPTGSGKTTTMYAVLKILNTREKNIATIEDPVEYEIEGINQIQVNNKTNLTFANGLRSILRQDPDTIYVGEIRDKETADIAINSALTGHLVLSTLHTNNAATALPRFIDMAVEPFLVASTINTIVAQRLVRTICPHCKGSIPLTKGKDGTWQGDAVAAAALDKLGSALINRYFGRVSEVRLYRGKGCNACRGTGYLGRLGIFEVLEVTPKIEELIIQKANAEVITKQAIVDGMSTMFDDGMGKVKDGLTTIEEVMRVTEI